VELEGVVERRHMDLHACIASAFCSSEQEIRVVEGAPVKLVRLWADRKPVRHPLLGRSFPA